MSTQQDIYVADSENLPPMLNKENYVLWSSRLLWYAKSKPNGNLIYNSIINGSYVRRIIPKPCDQNHEVPVNETFHEQTDDELTEKELKQLMNDFKRNKHLLEKINSNLKFLNNLQTKWSQRVTIVHQTKDLHTTDYTQLYDFWIANQNPNGSGNVLAAQAKGNVTGNNGNQIRCYNCRGLGHFARNYTVRPRRRDAADCLKRRSRNLTPS
uniref:CCHC-type domain-containing protein n=1 Tax=Tanacetum cinerariifolium TaxID=118510 RepID=A0A6L2JBG3_TANCI|nr:hypothetical protein [Tanacetum cinerariifolium]